MTRRLVLVVGLGLFALLGLVSAALAFWSVSSTAATGAAAASSLGTPQVSTSAVTSVNVTLTVTAPSTGPTPTSYRLDRTAPGSLISSMCTVTGSSGSCNDTSPIAGQVNAYAAYAQVGTLWISSAGTTSVAVPSADSIPPVVPAPTVAVDIKNGATVSSAATDAASGVSSVAYYFCAGTSQCITGGILIGSSSTGPAYTLAWNAQPADGNYQVYAIGVDNAANSNTSTTSSSTKVDNTLPTAPTVTVAANIKNGANVSSAATDGGSGVSSVAYFYCAGVSQCVTGGTLIGTASTGPAYNLTWNSQPADGDYQVYATATDNAGNAHTVATSSSSKVDNTLPAVPAVTVAVAVKNGATVSSAVTDGGSGVASVSYFYCAGSAQCVTGGTSIGSSSTGPSYSVTWSSQPADGAYQIYATAIDSAANSRTAATSSSTVVDNSVPTFAVTTSGANAGVIGSTVFFRPTGAGSFTVTATDAQSGVTSSSFPAAPTGFTRSLGTNAATYTLSGGTATSGSLAVSATNGAGGVANLSLTLTAYGSGGVGSAVDTTNAGVAGTIAAGDTVVLTYSHAMRADSLLAGWNGTSRVVTMKITDTAGADVLSVSSPTGVNVGTVALGSTAWATADITWSDSTMVLSADGTTVTLTVGSACLASNGNCGSKLNSVSGSTTFSWTPSASALDQAGNATATTVKTGTSKTNF